MTLFIVDCVGGLQMRRQRTPILILKSDCDAIYRGLCVWAANVTPGHTDPNCRERPCRYVSWLAGGDLLGSPVAGLEKLSFRVRT